MTARETSLRDTCPGIEIEPGVFSGCSAKESPDSHNDCPICGDESLSRCHQNLGWHAFGAGPCFDTADQARAFRNYANDHTYAEARQRWGA